MLFVLLLLYTEVIYQAHYKSGLKVTKQK